MGGYTVRFARCGLWTLTCIVIALVLPGCSKESEHAPTVRPMTRSTPRPMSLEEMRPKVSVGPRPAGTREDPFIGEAVIMGIAHPPNKPPQLLVKHREIPYFMIPMQMTVFVSQTLIDGLSDGDRVRLYFARTDDVPSGFTAAQMWHGHELFRVEKISDLSTSTVAGNHSNNSSERTHR